MVAMAPWTTTITTMATEQWAKTSMMMATALRATTYDKGCVRCNVPDIIKKKEEDRGNRDGGGRGGAIVTERWKMKMMTTDNNGDGATGDEDDDDGDGATGRRH